MSYPDTLLLINGVWRAASGGTQIPVENPATEDIIGHVAHASCADLDEALSAADVAFQSWKLTSPLDRSRLMRAAADLMRQRANTIALLLTLEQGKPLAQALAEVTSSADIIDWFAEEARRSYGQVIPARAPGVLQITVKDPVGPVAAFTPWNFPVSQLVRKLAAALCTGCTLIVKAPEETPASPAAMIACFIDAGLPPGVVNLVFGIPSEISEHLIPHPVIRKISFTGSTPVGKHLAALAGLHMKRATMELGGHAPVLVFNDADVEQATELMVTHKFRNAGQVCVSPTRFLLQDGIADRFIAGFTRRVESLQVGDGREAQTQMGPLANSRRIAAMDELVQDAIEKGARLICGGRTLGNKGWFYAPTVLTDVPTEARIMNEEPFGPVAILNRIETVEDGLKEANRLPFGLAAYAFTGSSRTAAELRASIRAGMLSINHLGLALPEVPFGGIGDSGHGTEGGSEAIEAYLETRFITQMF